MSSDESPPPAEPRSRRIFIIPVAAVVIIALTSWRLANPRRSVSPDVALVLMHPAPSFQLYDQGSDKVKSRIVNLEAYLHRHTIVLAFFDGRKGPEADETLVQLREYHTALEREGIVVFGISTALPQENRNNSRRIFPFRLLSDVDARHSESVHRVWGRFLEPPSLDKPPGTKPGVFIINRTGLVAWKGNGPVPETHPESIVATLLKR